MSAEYVHLLNIERFERLLQSEPDEAKRRIIQNLLAEERAKNFADHALEFRTPPSEQPPA